MAYSTALEEEEQAGWQCCMPPRGSFGVLSPSQGAAERVRNRDNPPPQPRPVEAHSLTLSPASEVDFKEEPVAEAEPGDIILCQAVPAGDAPVVIELYDP